MNNKLVVIGSLLTTILLGGCQSSFYKLSKQISSSYSKSYSDYDKQHNHPVRVFVRKNHIDSYNPDIDTLTFVQYADPHSGDASLAVILNRRVFFPFSDTNTNGVTDAYFFPQDFLSAVSQWDIPKLDSYSAEESVHYGTTFIARLVRRKVEVLKPRSYNFK